MLETICISFGKENCVFKDKKKSRIIMKYQSLARIQKHKNCTLTRNKNCKGSLIVYPRTEIKIFFQLGFKNSPLGVTLSTELLV